MDAHMNMALNTNLVYLWKYLSCKHEEEYFQDHITLDCVFSPRIFTAVVVVFVANKWF